MTNRRTKPPTYLDRLLSELDEIHTGYAEILAASAIVNIDPNRHGVGPRAIPCWRRRGWSCCGACATGSRASGSSSPHPTPTVSKRLDEHIGRLQRWLVRERDHGVPSTMDKAVEMIDADVADLRALAEVLPRDEHAVRLTVDTNTLIDNPDLAAHTGTIGRRHMAHLLPVVLREIDDLKRGGRTQDLRAAASARTGASRAFAPTATCAPASAWPATRTPCSSTSSRSATGCPPGST